MEQLIAKILNIGVILSDHTKDKPSVIYGHPNSNQWAEIFILAAKLKESQCP